MNGFREIQQVLDRILGSREPNHGAFWTSATRDEFVEMSVYGLPLITLGDPDSSNLVKSLRGIPPFGSDLDPAPPGAFMPRMPAGGAPPANEGDIRIIEEWITNDCPEIAQHHLDPLTTAAANSVSDDTHVAYWRAIDDFFLPGLSSEETAVHVGRMHAAAFLKWHQFVILGAPETEWSDYLAQPDVQESFEYVRHHQQRLIIEFYRGAPSILFDSLWKFGGNLLPEDPLSNALPKHTMNGVRDWCFWIPQLDATLRQNQINDIDLNLARAWQIGIAADGLLRRRLSIPEFSPSSENLQELVTSTYKGADPATLQDLMRQRARLIFANQIT